LKKVLIIGGGWAGLSAAVQAIKSGAKVTLIEAKNELGGRARSVNLRGHTVDNGQHILIGAYRATLGLMSEVGLTPQTLLHRCRLSLLNNQSQGFELTGPHWLPLFFQFLLATLKCQNWTLVDKWSLLQVSAQWFLQGFKCSATSSVTEISEGASSLVMSTFITPLCLSALNTPPESTSGQIFLRVLKDAMLSGAGSSDFLIPRCTLGELFPQACERWLIQRGCVILKGKRLEQLPTVATPIEQAFSSDPLEAPDAIIIACDATNAARLTSQLNPSWATSAQSLEHTQIATTYIKCNDPTFKGLKRALTMLRSDSDSSGQIRAPAQFVFDRRLLFTDNPGQSQENINKTLLAFVSSYATLTNDQISLAVMDQASKELGLQSLELLGTITERRATFFAKPGVVRPTYQVANGVWACGDYVQGPYPSTIEGAVLSGIQVFEKVIQSFQML